ncbi:MAG: BTAD domain-containing putative transcriptional regulator [Gemmatimonadota bacterium]
MVTGTGSSSIEFRVLGSVFLTGPEGNQLHSILARPKLVALLTRLAVEPGAFVRRDTLIGLLWPALDMDRARSALRQSLYHLRRSLGEAVVLSRGDDEVGLDAGRIWCDAAAMSDALAGGDREAGVELYRGDLLEGFFLPGAPEFERWMEGRREALRESAARAAAELAEQRAAEADPAAAHWARLGIRLTPLDEARLRACLKVFVTLDDRASVVREYDAFAARLSDDLGLEPSRETRDLVAGLRAASSATESVPTSEPVAEDASEPGADEAADAAEDADARPEPTDPPVVRTRAFRLGAAAGAVVVLGLLALWAFMPDQRPLDRGRVLVTTFVNDTGDPELEPLGRMTEDWIVRGLEETGLIDVVVLTGQAGESVEDSVRQVPGAHEDRALDLATTAAAGVAVTGAIYAVGDSVQIEAQVLDVARRRHLASIEPARAAWDQPLEALEEVRQRVAGALAMALDGRIDDFTNVSRQPPTYEAYLAFVEGEDSYNRAFDRSRSSDFGEAQQLFLRAFALDSTLTVAIMRAAESAWLNLDGRATDSLAQVAAVHRESFNAFSRARLDLLQARLVGDRDAALRAARRLTSTPLDRAIAAFQANRPAETVETLESASDYARAVGDFGYYGIEVSYWLFLANAHHLLGAHEEEIEVVRLGRDRYPDEVVLAALEMRALAALGRVDELQRVIDSSLRLPRVRAPWLGGGIWRAAGELRAHGNVEASLVIANRAVDWYLALPPDEAAAWGARNGHAKSYYVAERWEESEAAFLAMDEERPDIRDVVGFLGVLAARRGDREEALRRAERVAQIGSPYEHGRGVYWQACIAAQLGDHERGISLLLEAYSQGRAMDVGLHSDMDLEPLHDDPRYQELVRPKG